MIQEKKEVKIEKEIGLETDPSKLPSDCGEVFYTLRLKNDKAIQQPDTELTYGVLA
jgi:hypothetical protein